MASGSSGIFPLATIASMFASTGAGRHLSVNLGREARKKISHASTASSEACVHHSIPAFDP